jgi:ABC-2 type transport system permease protein
MTLISIGFMGTQITSPALFVISLSLTVLALSALGALVAVSVKEVFEAQTLSNYFRFPMIFLCGVFLPVEAMPVPLQALAHILPLTYSVDALRQTSTGLVSLRLILDITALVMFLLAFLILATRLLQKSLE